MTLHFAYGANMSRAIVRRHAAGARAVGAAELPGHRFVITADGYASVESAPAQSVHGVLWRITPRDRVTLDAWENLDGGLYRAEMLPVRCAAPRGLEEMPEELSQPEYATVVGLLLYGARARRQAPQRPANFVAKIKSMFAGA